MSTQFDSELEDALDEVADDVEVVHVDAATDETEIESAVWNPARRARQRYEGDQQETATGTLTVAASAVPTLTTESSFRIDGVTYAVESIGGTGLLDIELVARDQKEAAMQEHRIRR